MSLKVKEKTIYYPSDRPLTEAEQQSHDARYVHGPLPPPNMADMRIRDEEWRKQLKKGEGGLCVGIQPGEKLGELHVNIQFEGPKGEWDFCMEGQNDLLIYASEWLKEIFGEFAADWEVKIAAEPCPKADLKLEVVLASQVLEGTLAVNKALEQVETTFVVEEHPQHHPSQTREIRHK